MIAFVFYSVRSCGKMERSSPGLRGSEKFFENKLL
jgi:hypothetical protein